MRLRTFTYPDLPIVETWFADPQTRAYLGGPEWPRQMLDLAQSQPGTEFRGARGTGAYRWLGCVDGVPVGYIDCGTVNRWTTWDGSGVVRAVERPVGFIAHTVAPEHRGRGLGRAMIRALPAEPALAGIEVLGAGVEPANTASIRSLRAAGFVQVDAEPDFEGMLYFALDITDRDHGRNWRCC